MIHPSKITDPHVDVTKETSEDHRLILALKDGDEEALKGIIHKYTSPLLRIAERILHDEETAKDVVQDIFCWVWENKKRMSIPGSLIGYLGRATSNRAISELRKRNARATLVATIEATNNILKGSTQFRQAAHPADESILEEDLQAALRVALSRLQPRAREIFLLHLDDGLTYSEIAEALDITIETVRMQMYRATKQLAAALKPFISDA